ncbi:EamA family transporter, partial [Brachyspira pilosicoli]|nr:EamA family transporter [Brachyspira pilosicoli]
MGKSIFLFVGVTALSMSAIFARLANAPSSITAFY